MGFPHMLIRHISLPRRKVKPLKRGEEFHGSFPGFSFKYFLDLPGEIRNEIYNLLIIPALASCKYSAFRSYQLYTPPPLFNSPDPTPIKIHITATPRWEGTPSIRIQKIGPLQILLVNKQVHDEVSTLLYSHAKGLTIGGYILQSRDEDPSARWKEMFGMLQRRTGLLWSVTNLTIRLPSQREDLLKGHWRVLGFLRPPREKTVSLNLWAGIPDMVRFVEKFPNLKKFHIVVTIEDRDPPNMEDLFRLYRSGRLASQVEVLFAVATLARGNLEFLGKWNDAWRRLLVEKEEVEVKVAIERSMLS